jgi:hypothetical protein
VDFLRLLFHAEEAQQAVFDVDAIAGLDVVDEGGDGGGDAEVGSGDGSALDDERVAGVDGLGTA